jgi:uncharacterized protein (DUF1015 family)
MNANQLIKQYDEDLMTLTELTRDIHARVNKVEYQKKVLKRTREQLSVMFEEGSYGTKEAKELQIIRDTLKGEIALSEQLIERLKIERHNMGV